MTRRFAPEGYSWAHIHHIRQVNLTERPPGPWAWPHVTAVDHSPSSPGLLGFQERAPRYEARSSGSHVRLLAAPSSAHQRRVVAPTQSDAPDKTHLAICSRDDPRRSRVAQPPPTMERSAAWQLRQSSRPRSSSQPAACRPSPGAPRRESRLLWRAQGPRAALQSQRQQH